MFERRLAQCDGICRPALAGSSFEPTAARNMSSGVTPSARQSARSPVSTGRTSRSRRAAAGPRPQYGFVAGTADLEIGERLVPELQLLVVDLPRQEHDAVRLTEIFP
jgi:hypothetical protein